MSTEVANFFGGGAQVPAMSNVAKALTDVARDAGQSLSDGGKPILKLNKGDWCYGASNTDVEEGSEWAISPMTIKRGYVAWKDRKPFKSAMAGIGEAAIKTSDLEDLDGIEHTTGQDKGKPVRWDECVAFDLLCITGEDKGTVVAYETTTYGGRKAATEVIENMARAAAQDEHAIIPVVVLDKDSYQHKEYGKVFTPIFDIQEFVSADDLADVNMVQAPAPEPEPEPEPEPKLKRSSRRKAEAAEAVEGEVMDAEVVEDEPASPPPGRRRRRPS